MKPGRKPTPRPWKWAWAVFEHQRPAFWGMVWWWFQDLVGHNPFTRWTPHLRQRGMARKGAEQDRLKVMAFIFRQECVWGWGMNWSELSRYRVWKGGKEEKRLSGMDGWLIQLLCQSPGCLWALSTAGRQMGKEHDHWNRQRQDGRLRVET